MRHVLCRQGRDTELFVELDPGILVAVIKRGSLLGEPLA
jgi:hypothetical protein